MSYFENIENLTLIFIWIGEGIPSEYLLMKIFGLKFC